MGNSPSRHCTLLAAICAVLLASPMQAATRLWVFENRSYYDPLVAGVREPHLSALALGFGDRVPFLVDDSSPRSIWDIDVGAEMPIIGWDSEPGKDLSPGGLGIGFWIPIDFHMLEDLVDNSGPIVNTDYRFGGMLKVRYGLPRSRWLAARLLVGHESTHLGDEFSIVGARRFPRSFERINVSWEFADLGVLYEHSATIPWNARAGATVNLRGSYYSTDQGSVTESALGPVVPSKNRIDPYVGFEMSREELFTLTSLGSFDGYASVEVRWRSVYEYHRPRRDVSEERQLSTNVIIGIRKTGTDRGFGRASPFVRFYHGVNPHGQFRNQKDYTEFGVGVRLVR